MGAFPAAIIMGFMNYINFSGVASRAEYWYWALFTFLISLTLALGQFAFFVPDLATAYSADSYTQPTYSAGYLVLGILSSLFSLAAFLPSLAVLVRRLHDAGYSGLSYFWSFVPFVGPFILLYRLLQPTQHMARDTYGY